MNNESLPQSRKSQMWNRVAVYTAIVVLFLLLLFGAYRASDGSRSSFAAEPLSNGTAQFAPTTILISLDGFRADFLTRGLTPTLSAFIKEGVSPKYMLPSFPSLTFPNHYTMATGLYPESHGIVGNSFWDPAIAEEFYYTNKSMSMQPKWWGGDPIWETTERQGVKSAIHMWPGSEAHIGSFEPAYVDKYNGSEKLSRKVDRILELLDKPGPDSPYAVANQPRPQLIAAYVPNVDSDGHAFGPNSTEIRQTIKDVDEMLGSLFKGLQDRNLTNIVNVVVVSDHGMATTSAERLFQLEDLVDMNKIEHTDGWPLFGLRPKKAEDTQGLYEGLKAKLEGDPNVDVYLRDKDMPERYHFSNNDRIAPLWIVPQAGWAIVTKEDYDVKEGLRKGEVYRPRGLHGYDFEHPLMRAIFVARGPAFPHKPNSRVEPFQNTELYNIICDSLRIEPSPNNGTLRLPFKPVGLHSDLDAPEDESPVDLPVSSFISFEETKLSPTLEKSGSIVPHFLTFVENPTVPPNAKSTETSEGDPSEQGETKTISSTKGFWDWINSKFDAAKERIIEIFSAPKNSSASKGDGG